MQKYKIQTTVLGCVGLLHSVAVVGGIGVTVSCQRPANKGTAVREVPRDDIAAWTLGLAHRARGSGRSELGLLVMNANGKDRSHVTKCNTRFSDILPTGRERDQYFIVIDGRLHIGKVEAGAVPTHVRTVPADLELSTLMAVSRSHTPTILLAEVLREQDKQLWEFEIHEGEARGTRARRRGDYKSFASFRESFRVDRCDVDGRRCLITTKQKATGTVRVSASRKGPGTGNRPMFEISECDDAVRGWWSPNNDETLYVLASCKKTVFKQDASSAWRKVNQAVSTTVSGSG